MNRVRFALATVLAGGTVLTGCTTMGGNVKGNFACSAPDGICAPSSTIDDRALAMISGQDGDRMIAPAGPYAAPSSEGRGFDTVSSVPARSQDRVLRIVFPAQIDAAGRLHEQSAVHAVVEQSEWRRAVAGTVVANTPQQVAAATGSDTLLSAVERADPPALSENDVDPDMPSPAAVAGARAKADPVGDIKDQVARRLANKPVRLNVDRNALPGSTSVTYRAQSPATTPGAVISLSGPKPLTPPPSATVRQGPSTPAITVPARATAAGLRAIAEVSANTSIQSSLARAEPEAREAAKFAIPLPVLRASSFPGVVP